MCPGHEYPSKSQLHIPEKRQTEQMTMIAQVGLNLLFTKDKKNMPCFLLFIWENVLWKEFNYFVLFSLCFHSPRTESGDLQARQVP